MQRLLSRLSFTGPPIALDCLVTCLVAALAAGPAIAEDPAPLSFVRDIQPVLQARFPKTYA